MRTRTSHTHADGILNVEFVADAQGGYVWFGLGTRCLGTGSLKGLENFLKAARKAQAKENAR